MMHLWRKLLLLFATLVFALPLAAADYLFVFHDDPTVRIYDAESLQLLASPALGPGAVQAIGVPDPDHRDRLLKIYLIRNNSVLVLDPQPPFAIRATLPLAFSPTVGERSAVLTPDGRELLLLTGPFIHAFDTINPTNPIASIIDLTVPVTDLAVLPSSQFAYVVRPGMSQLGILSLTVSPPQLLAGPVLLPSVPTAVGIPANDAGIYAASEEEIFEVNTRTNLVTHTVTGIPGAVSAVGFYPRAPIETGFVTVGSALSLFDMPTRRLTRSFNAGGTIQEVLSPGLDRIYLRAGTPGKFYRALPSTGGFSELVHPATASPFTLPAVDMEVDEASRFLFLAFGTLGSVIKLSADASQFLDGLDLPSAATGIALVSTLGASPSVMEVYGGNNQFAAAGERLPKSLAARALASDGRPVKGEVVKFSADQSGTVFTPPTAPTDRNGVARTSVLVPVTTPFEVEAEATGGAPKTVFDVNAGVEGRDGVHIVSGNHQIAASNQPFPTPFVVQVVDEANPAPGLQLTVTPLNVNIDCTVPPLTDGDGKTSFECTVPFTVTGTRRIEQIQVGDPAGRVLADPFSVILVPSVDDLPVVLRIFSPKSLTGVAGETQVNAIRFDAITKHGVPVGDVGTQFVTTNVFVDPPFVTTEPIGLTMANVQFGCTLGPGTISVELNAANIAPQTINVTTVIGLPAQAIKIGGDGQFGQEGDRLQELRIVVRDLCNNRIPSSPVEWTISPAGSAVFERAARNTNIDGEAFAFLRLGSLPGPFQVTARSGAASAIFLLSVNATALQMVIVSGDGQSVMAQSAAQSLVVELRNEAGQPLPGGAVEFEVTEGSGTVSPAVVQSNPLGRASTAVTTGGVVGPLTVVARSSGLEVAFHLNVVGRLPAVPATGIVNGGSSAVGLVPGSAASIYGVGLMEGVNGVISTGVPYLTTLQGVRVLVNGVPAPILALANIKGLEQINIQVPFETPAPAVNVTDTIENNGTSKTFSGIRTFRAQPGIFEILQGSTRVAAALHLDSTIVNSANPARPGEIISLFLTGMGHTNPPLGTNVPGPIPAPLTVERPLVIFDGLNSAQVLGSAYAPTFITAYQINLVVPPGTPAGNRAIRVQAGGILSQQAVLPVAVSLPTP